jgi:hypothetical protein
MTLVLAHPGHWGASVKFLVPTVGFIGWLFVTTLKERQRERHEDRERTPVGDDEQ